MAERKNIVLCNDGIYRWIYEVNMLRTPIILYEVFWVIGVTVAICFIINLLIALSADGFSLKALLFPFQVSLIVGGIMSVLVFPAYWIVAMKNGKKYVVLHEMAEDGIVHRQMDQKVKRKKALLWIGVLAGLAAGKPGLVGSTILAHTHTSLSSTFERVKKVKAVRRHHCIFVNGRFVRNRIFVDDDDFQFVFDYIASRCVNAKIKP